MIPASWRDSTVSSVQVSGLRGSVPIKVMALTLSRNISVVWVDPLSLSECLTAGWMVSDTL